MFILGRRIALFIFGIKPFPFVKVKSMNCGSQCISRKSWKNKDCNFYLDLKTAKFKTNLLAKRDEKNYKQLTLLSICCKEKF